MKSRHLVLFLVSAVIVAAAIVDGGAAQAFPTLKFWHMPASGPAGQNRAGADGIYGTGGPRDFGIQCAHCHIGAAGQIGLDIQANPPFVQQNNSYYYEPNTLYDIVVTMTGEHLSGPNNSSINGVVVSFEDPGGATLGVLRDDNGNDSGNCPSAAPTAVPAGTTYIWGDCHAILFSGQPNTTQWQFQWTAPAAGKGEVTMWYGAVDGNAQAESSLGDDVLQGNRVLLEGS